MKREHHRFALTALSFLFASAAAFAAEPARMLAKADGKGKVEVDVVYQAADTCVSLADVKEGHPPQFEAPQRNLSITVTVEHREKGPCQQKLNPLVRHITIQDRPGVKSIDIFVVNTKGQLETMLRPRIYRDEKDIE